MSDPELSVASGGASNLGETAEAVTAAAHALAFGEGCNVVGGPEGHCRVLGRGAVSECAYSCEIGAQV